MKNSGVIKPAILRPLAIIFYFLVSTFYLSDFSTTATAETERAKALIERARMSIGGEDAIGRVQSLSVKGKVKRYVKYVSVRSPKSVEDRERILSGNIELDFSFPDRFRRKYSTQVLRGYNYSYTETVNRDRAWRNPPIRVISSYRDNRVIDVDDFERTTQLQARGARQQISLYTLGLLLQEISVFPLNYSYMGLMETSAGEADVISVQGPEDFQAFLLLDPKNSFPKAVAIAFIDAVQPAVLVESPGFFDRRIMQATFQRARDERRKRMQKPRRYEMQLQFSDYRQVDGVMLPHHISHVLNGELVEDVFFDEFRINRNIKSRKFEGKQKPVY